MAGVQLTGQQIKDGSIFRTDLNTTTTGNAVITKVIGSVNIALASTGVDAGTGDVTLNLTTTGVDANTYQSVTVDVYGRITAAGSLTSAMIPSGSGFYIQNGSGSQSGNFNITGNGQMSTLILNAAGGHTLTLSTNASQSTDFILKFPANAGSNNQALITDGAGNLNWSTTGTVTSVALSAPSIFSIAGSPVTTTGTLALSLATQTQHTFFAGQISGTGVPTFRAIDSTDIPDLSGSYLPVAGGNVSGPVTIGSAANNAGGLGVSNGSVQLQVDAAVKALLHFDGASSSRALVDMTGKSWFVDRSASISTVTSKFGGSSLLFNGTDSRVMAASTTSDFAFGTGAFTIDFWVNFVSVTGTQTLVDLGGSTAGIRISSVAGTSLQVIIANSTFTFTMALSTATWYHVAVTRSGTNLRAFVGGSQIGTTQTSSGSIAGSANLATLGATNTQGTAATTNFFSGYLDELRILNTAAWTAGFTPSIVAYDFNTVVRWGNTTTEAGMILVVDGQGRSAVRRPPRVATASFCLGEAVSNTQMYFYVGRALGTTQDNNERSGSSSGMGFANACSPWICPFNGRIIRAVLTIQGAGVNQAAATYPCAYNVSLYRVGFSAAQDPAVNGGSANTISFPLWSGVGAFSVGSVNTVITVDSLNILVSAGQALALQFVNGSTAAIVGMSQMAFVSLALEEVG